MTIQLKDTIFISGVHQAAGTSLTLDAAAEAELVNRKVAVYTALTLTPGENETPVTATRDASGNVVGLAVGGKRIASVCLLHYENDGGFTALPGSAEQIVGSVVMIPANTLKPGDKLQYVCVSEDAGTADAQTRASRIRIHTTASVLSGQVLTTGAVATANNSKLAIDKAIVIVSNTKAKYVPSVAAGVISTATFSDAMIDCTVDQYIGFTVQNNNTLVNHLFYFVSLTLEQAQ